MAYTLKLNIYNFSLYRITNTIERHVRGEVRIKYETEADATPSGFRSCRRFESY